MWYSPSLPLSNRMSLPSSAGMVGSTGIVGSSGNVGSRSPCAAPNVAILYLWGAITVTLRSLSTLYELMQSAFNSATLKPLGMLFRSKGHARGRVRQDLFNNLLSQRVAPEVEFVEGVIAVERLHQPRGAFVTDGVARERDLQDGSVLLQSLSEPLGTGVANLAVLERQTQQVLATLDDLCYALRAEVSQVLVHDLEVLRAPLDAFVDHLDGSAHLVVHLQRLQAARQIGQVVGGSSHAQARELGVLLERVREALEANSADVVIQEPELHERTVRLQRLG
mmetsp:Transcript_32922/g.76585  ORF Transcript_32922/g.76585 Transcript_32922/m.76585 type:complete len:280 (-) Transcript_32922:300-1139(-)